jgi:DNA-binding transcriptional LysR family regulator
MNFKKLLINQIAKWMIGSQPLAISRAAELEPTRILVICYDAIGDFILSLPAIDGIRNKYPTAKIDLVCSQRNEVLAASVQGIDQCHVITLNDTLLPLSMWRKIRQLRQRQYDVVINMFDEPDDIDAIEYSDNYFSLLHELESLMGKRVDLLSEKSLKNAVLIAEIERTKVQLYAA